MKLEMILAPMFLWRAVQGHPVGDAWPYRGGTQSDIHQHLRSAAEVLSQGPFLDTESDFAMLFDDCCHSAMVYCTKKQDRPSSVHGITVFLCAFAPLAAFCPTTVHRTKIGMSHTMHLPQAGELPPGDWVVERQWLVSQLETLGFVVPSREELSLLLPHSSEIPEQIRGLSQFMALFF